MRKGFTLIEVLIVVIILGILATIALPRFAGLVERARKAEAMTYLGAIYTGAQVYYLEHDNVFPAAGTNIKDDLGIDLGAARYFTYSVLAVDGTKLGGQANRTVGSDTGNIQIRFEDGRKKADTNGAKLWGESTDWH